MTSFSKQQLAYAQQIAVTGQQMGMSTRDILTALTVALDESSLQNLANSSVPDSYQYAHDGVGSDHASVGIFQQQVGIWGTTSDLMNPTNEAKLFYEKLQTITNRNSMPIPLVAQTVQGSAFSDGSNYAAQLGNAQTLMTMISAGTTAQTADNVTKTAASPFTMITTKQGWTRIGLFALGILILYIAFEQLILSNPTVQSAVKTVVKVAAVA